MPHFFQKEKQKKTPSIRIIYGSASSFTPFTIPVARLAGHSVSAARRSKAERERRTPYTTGTLPTTVECRWFTGELELHSTFHFEYNRRNFHILSAHSSSK